MENMEKMLYGDVEGDDDLEAELAALMGDEGAESQQSRRRPNPPPSRAQPSPAKAARPAKPATPSHSSSDLASIDRLARQISQEATLAEDPDDPSVDNDEELLGEFDALVGGASTEGLPRRPSPPPPEILPPRPQGSRGSGGGGGGLVEMLSSRRSDYAKAEAAAKAKGDSAKARRCARAQTTLATQIRAAKAGRPVAEEEIPPPCVVPKSDEDPPKVEEPRTPEPPKPAPRPQAEMPPKQEQLPKAVAKEREPKPKAPPPIPPRREAPVPQKAKEETEGMGGVEIPEAVPPATIEMLSLRRDAYKREALAAKKADDNQRAMQNAKVAKQFDAVLAAIACGEEVDLSNVPPMPEGGASSTSMTPPPPPPVKRASAASPPSPPKTLLEGLQSRLAKYEATAAQAGNEGNERRKRMMLRIAAQYKDAIKAHKAGRALAVDELPCPPGFPPLPAPTATAPPPSSLPAKSPPSANQPARPSQTSRPTPQASAKPSKQEQQLEFLVKRQMQFKKAALAAKQAGKIKAAKEYLRQAKGFDQMIAASRAGLPVDIRATPTPPQATAPAQALRPTLPVSVEEASGGWSLVQGSREEIYSQLEKDLIRQLQLSQANQTYFTRFGDVGRVEEYERMATGLKKDLVTLRQACQHGDPPPRFRYETRSLPSLQSHPDLGDEDLEIGVVRALMVKLPSGFEEKHAEIFVRFELPYPQDSPQSGKTSVVRQTTSPAFNERQKLRIGRKARAFLRLTKRHGIKFEVYQKGGFMRSDRLLGTCEAKFLPLETKAETHESLDLMEGRRAVGGKLEIRLRIREPLVSNTPTQTKEKWLVIDAFVKGSRLAAKTEQRQAEHQRRHHGHGHGHSGERRTARVGEAETRRHGQGQEHGHGSGLPRQPLPPLPPPQIPLADYDSDDGTPATYALPKFRV